MMPDMGWYQQNKCYHLSGLIPFSKSLDHLIGAFL